MSAAEGGGSFEPLSVARRDTLLDAAEYANRGPPLDPCSTMRRDAATAYWWPFICDRTAPPSKTPLPLYVFDSARFC